MSVVIVVTTVLLVMLTNVLSVKMDMDQTLLIMDVPLVPVTMLV